VLESAESQDAESHECGNGFDVCAFQPLLRRPVSGNREHGPAELRASSGHSWERPGEAPAARACGWNRKKDINLFWTSLGPPARFPWSRAQIQSRSCPPPRRLDQKSRPRDLKARPRSPRSPTSPSTVSRSFACLVPVGVRPTVCTGCTPGSCRHSRKTPCPTMSVAPERRTLISYSTVTDFARFLG
jgi:hypothetical protein